MHLTSTAIEGIFEAETAAVRDARGWLARLFCSSDLHDAHGDRPIFQINHTLTREIGAVRGLHFQYPPYAEAKWVRCLRGRVFDVALDLRSGSPTFLRWHACELDAQRQNALFIPEGCAHGFQTLLADSELLYLHTAPYSPQAEGAVHALDPRLAIPWPLEVTEMSERDKNHPLLPEDYQGILA